MSGLQLSFSRRLDRPFPESMASLQHWLTDPPRWLAVRRTADSPVGCALAVRVGRLGRTVPMEVRVTPWSETEGTHVEIVPRRRIRATRRYFARCRSLLSELTGALAPAVGQGG